MTKEPVWPPNCRPVRMSGWMWAVWIAVMCFGSCATGYSIFLLVDHILKAIK